MKEVEVSTHVFGEEHKRRSHQNPGRFYIHRCGVVGDLKPNQQLTPEELDFYCDYYAGQSLRFTSLQFVDETEEY